VWFQELALAVCAQAGIAQRFHHLDLTRCSLTGGYIPDRDERAMTITPGSSKDHRPDLKPAGWPLMVSQAGGVPCVRNSWEGQTSDLHVFQERAQALMTAFEHTPSPRSLLQTPNAPTRTRPPTSSPWGSLPVIPTPWAWSPR
jgi:transposase